MKALQDEIQRLRTAAENMRECARRASSSADMRREMAQAEAIERKIAELEGKL